MPEFGLVNCNAILRYVPVGGSLMLSNARAGEVEEKAFHYAIASYLQTHPLQYPADLLDLQTEGHAKVAFAVDRDGKLVDARITAGSGSTKADQDILDWLRHLQPFPKAPAEVSAPVEFSEEIVLVPTKLVSSLKIRWVIDADAAPRQAVFRDLVASHLQHHPRTYTDEMKAWHDKRHTTVALTIDRSGKLVNLELVKAFGSQAADQETLAWLVAAQPYPSIPADLTAPLQLRADLEFGPPGKSSEGLWDDGKIKRAINNVCKGC